MLRLSDIRAYSVIAAALGLEYNAVLKALKLETTRVGGYKLAFTEPDPGNRLLIKTGYGLQAAGRALAFLIDNFKLISLVNVGLAGAVTPELGIGDILLADEVAAEGTDVLRTDPTCTAALADRLSSHAFSFKPGRLLSVEKAVLNRDKRQYIFQHYQALAVDMEAFALLQICRANAIPFICLKVISDKWDFSLVNIPALFKNLKTARQKLTRITNLL
jgi:adenosylhomocysteine nucleosidase